MAVKLRYFAWVRERIGRGEEELSPPDEVTTIAGLVEWLKTQGEEYQLAFAQSDVIRAAINMTHVEANASFEPGAEIAFFPPVTGG